MKMKVESGDAPAAIGPYSQAVRTRDFLFTSGVVPIDPATGRLVGGGVAEQTARVLENARAILAEAGCTFENVVKTLVFLADMDDFAVMNGVYADFFDGAVKPARSTVQVSRLPLGALVEIEMVAEL